MTARETPGRDHPWRCARVQCPTCGRFASQGWDSGDLYTEDGWNQRWGGVCSVHGEFSESAA
jgi:hypothetical protein